MNKRYATRERGVVLVVALILLVIMTLLTLSGVRMAAFDERMSANTYDRGLAFQAAEAALRAGEAVALAQSKASPLNSGFKLAGLVYGGYTDADGSCATSPCQNGLCSIPDKDCTARWLDSSFAGWVDCACGLTSLATTPQYFVEFLGANFPCNVDTPGSGAQDCKRYRVTARSDDGTSGRSMVILQSIYAAE